MSSTVANCDPLDPIFAKHEPILDGKLAEANKALAKVDDATRHKLERKLLVKQKNDGKKSITDADRRRWQLPAKERNGSIGRYRSMLTKIIRQRFRNR